MAIFVSPWVYGDSGEALGGRARARGQLVEQTLGREPYPFASGVIGDAPKLAGHAEGGDDMVRHFGGITSAIAVGDAQTIAGHGRGGDDDVLAIGRSSAEAYGDAFRIEGHGVGGDDLVHAISRFGSTVYGDARILAGHARGGDDQLSASTDRFVRAVLFGDAETMEGHARGGDDVLNAAGGSPGGSILYGDARVLAGRGVGGEDTLVSGFGPDTLFGDAEVVGPRARTGADLFVFGPDNGHDVVMDFQPGKDRIELDGLGLDSLADVLALARPTADGLLISFSAEDDILLRGLTAADLGRGDFVFTG